MNDDQFNKIMAMLEIITQNTAMLVAQGQLQRPLTGEETGQSVESVRRVSEMIAGGLELGVLPPGIVSVPG